MKILLVEDDEDKSDHIQEFLDSTYVLEELEIARSLQSGLKAIFKRDAELILLDMTMRNFDRTIEDDGGRPHAFAGREMLRQMKREKISIPVVIVTQFESFGQDSEKMTLDQLSQELLDRFDNYLGTVRYKSNIDDWQEGLKALIGDRFPQRTPRG